MYSTSPSKYSHFAQLRLPGSTAAHSVVAEPLVVFRLHLTMKPWENHGKTIGKPWENHG